MFYRISGLALVIKLNLFLQYYFYTNTYLETDFQNFHISFSCFCLLNLIQKIKTECRGVLTVIFSSVTQTQTRTQLARVWLEYESSGIKLSVSGV